MRPKAIFIDAGHGLGDGGGFDDGAVGQGTSERKEVVEIAEELIELIAKDPELIAMVGKNIFPVGVGNRMSLTQKVRFVKDQMAKNGWSSEEDAVLVSIHLNAADAPSARGVESWYGKSDRYGPVLAKFVSRNVAESTGFPLRVPADKSSAVNRLGRLAILDDTVPSSCLVECGFVTNEFDAKALKDQLLDNRFAVGIHRGIRAFLGLPPDAEGTFYVDVPENEWYSDAVRHCLEKGVFVLPADRLFHPDRAMTRAEVAATLSRLLKIVLK